MRDLGTIVAHLRDTERSTFRDLLLDAGMTTAHAVDLGNDPHPDRRQTFGHARLAALLEEA